MLFKKGDIATVNNIEYLIVETSRYEDEDYVFANKLNDKEESTEDYYVMKQNINKLDIVSNNNVLEVLLPIFQNKIQKDIDLYNAEKQYEI